MGMAATVTTSPAVTFTTTPAVTVTTTPAALGVMLPARLYSLQGKSPETRQASAMPAWVFGACSIAGLFVSMAIAVHRQRSARHLAARDLSSVESEAPPPLEDPVE